MSQEQLLLPSLSEADGIVSHAMVMSRKRGKISLNTARVLAYMFARLNTDKKVLEHIITSEDLKHMGIKKNLKNAVTKICLELSSHAVRMEDDDYEDYIPLVMLARKHKKTNNIEFQFNSLLRKYFVEIKKNFSKYNLGSALSMNNTYGFYMYLLARRFLHGDSFSAEVSVDELKHALGCAGKYSLWTGFEQRVLNPLKTEFCENKEIDIIFDYTPIKTGNKVTHLKLTFVRKDRTPRKSLSKVNKVQEREAPHVPEVDAAAVFWDNLTKDQQKKVEQSLPELYRGRRETILAGIANDPEIHNMVLK